MSVEPSSWDSVKDSDLFIMGSIDGNKLLNNTEGEAQWKSTFIDPVLSGEEAQTQVSIQGRPSTLYANVLKDKENLEQLLPRLHLQSSKFEPKTFVEVLHKKSSLQLLRKGRGYLTSADEAATKAELRLIFQNVQHFAMAKQVLDDVHDSIFVQKEDKQDIYTKLRYAKDTFKALSSNLRNYVEPIKERAQELKNLDRDMQFLNSLDELFNINAEIVRYVENKDIKKFVECYKEYKKKLHTYKRLTKSSSLTDRIEFIVKKAQSLILTKLLEEDKVSLEKLEESLKYLRELETSSNIIEPLLKERKNRLLNKIVETFSPMIHDNATKGNLQQQSLAINLLKNEDTENKEDAILREKVKKCIDVQDSVDSFVNFLLGKNEQGVNGKIGQGFTDKLSELKKEIMEEVKIINQIVAIYKANENDLNDEEISTYKIFGEIVIYLCNIIEKTFIKKFISKAFLNPIEKIISVVHQITRLSIFPQESLLFNEQTLEFTLFLSTLERHFNGLFPESLLERFSRLMGLFIQAYVNKIFFNIYNNTHKIDLKSDLTLITLESYEEPLFINEFKVMLSQAIEDIAKLLNKIHKNTINGKSVIQILKIPLQNIVIHLLSLIAKEAEELVTTTKQQRIVYQTSRDSFVFDESVYYILHIAQNAIALYNGFRTFKNFWAYRTCL